ncbi:hypothetical protein Syun_025450 [Stephania yunnanensis]|uniref:Uncharacterized protein n=1 Tax=Stephania yunnanensis TaxID=152371 RepID=A0AAP0EUA7_9MAGN
MREMRIVRCTNRGKAVRDGTAEADVVKRLAMTASAATQPAITRAGRSRTSGSGCGGQNIRVQLMRSPSVSFQQRLKESVAALYGSRSKKKLLPLLVAYHINSAAGAGISAFIMSLPFLAAAVAHTARRK